VTDLEKLYHTLLHGLDPTSLYLTSFFSVRLELHLLTFLLQYSFNSAADMSNHMLLLLAIVANHYASTLSANTDQQIFNGFSTANLKLDGQASVTGQAIRLTQGISSEQGSAFYSKPLNFSSDNASTGDGGASFSTTFVLPSLMPPWTFWKLLARPSCSLPPWSCIICTTHQVSI